MSSIEKGRHEGSPIPKVVLADTPEFTANQFRLQIIQLTQRYAISAGMAEALAPMVFGVMS
jgi:hypothetical protein